MLQRVFGEGFVVDGKGDAILKMPAPEMPALEMPAPEMQQEGQQPLQGIQGQQAAAAATSSSEDTEEEVRE